MGINNDTRATLPPWFTNPVDRDVLIAATKDVISTYNQGEKAIFALLQSPHRVVAVSGLKLLYLELNSTTIENHSADVMFQESICGLMLGYKCRARC
jgi:hypothetical protein